MKVAGQSALVQIAASTQQITSHAGLVLVRELVESLGLPELLDAITVKKRKRGYSPAQSILGLCETLIAGGECLDDAALLRGDSAQELLRGHQVPDPTTLGRFLARFTLGHIGQLNRALDRLFARVHPLVGREQVTLDLDSTLVEHHGPAGSRQGTRGTYAGKVAWHPLLCFVAETGEWLHAKLRNGHAAASRGARGFIGECLRRLPADVRVFLRADEGFFGKDLLAELERKEVTYAVGAPLIASVRARISAVAEGDWRPSSYREGSEVASFVWKPKTWPVERRFVVRRDPVEPGEQLSLEGREWHYWALVTNDEERSADELESWHRDKANVENRIKEAKLGLGLDNPPLTWLPCQLGLPAQHPARLQPAHLAEAARPRRPRASGLQQTAPLPLHRRRRHRRPLRPTARPAPGRRLPAPHRLPPRSNACAASPARLPDRALSPQPTLPAPAPGGATPREHPSAASPATVVASIRRPHDRQGPYGPQSRPEPNPRSLTAGSG